MLQLMYCYNPFIEDSAMLHRNIIEKKLNMDELDKLDIDTLKSIATQCRIDDASNHTKVQS